MNKKVKNATSIDSKGIHFRSKVEEKCYSALKESGFNPKYEQKCYTLLEGFSPSVPFYVKNTFKRKNNKIQIVSGTTVVDRRKIKPWTYTPDLYFEYGKFIIHIEVKGFKNDVVRYKSKLFRLKLESMQTNDPEHIYEFWEIYNLKQLADCIEHIKNFKQQSNLRNNV